jgi:hypothetical protein
MFNQNDKSISKKQWIYKFATKDPEGDRLTEERQGQEMLIASNLTTDSMSAQERKEVMNSYFKQNNLNYECYSVKKGIPD